MGCRENFGRGYLQPEGQRAVDLSPSLGVCVCDLYIDLSGRHDTSVWKSQGYIFRSLNSSLPKDRDGNTEGEFLVKATLECCGILHKDAFR